VWSGKEEQGIDIINKMGKDTTCQFTKEETKLINKNMRKYSTSLATK
jgi:hypothetical protein